MRYIDADALLSRLPDDLPYKSSVKRVLMQAPESLTRVKYTPPTKDIEDFIVGYESPIQKYVNEIANDMQEKEDAYTMECIRNIGIDVNKEELVKALQYDRDQYNKGFTAGFRVAKSEVEEISGKYEDLKLKYADLAKDHDELLAWGGHIKNTEKAEIKKAVEREIIDDFDEELHKLAERYYEQGKIEYFTLCEVIYQLVIAKIKKKYTDGE